MRSKILLIFGIITACLGFFYPYFSGLIHFPSGGDFVAYYREFETYGTTDKIFESIGIWYEPGYFFLLYLLSLFINDFEISFILLEILIVILYFFAFYFLINAYSSASRGKKIIASIIFSLSAPQYLIFIFSIRKQFFAGIFFLIFLGLHKKYSKKLIPLGIVFSMLFFSHRGVSFYLGIFLFILLINSRFNFKNNFVKTFIYALLIGITVNISYLTPFVKTQYQLFLDTINAIYHNAIVATKINSDSKEYLARGWDMFGLSSNTGISYFLGVPYFFILILSNLKEFSKKIKNNFLAQYGVLIYILIYFGAMLAGRMAHFANMIFFVFWWNLLSKRKYLNILLSLFIVINFFQEVPEKQIRTRYFYEIDGKMLDFYNKVPRKNVFVFDLGNPFVGFSGYTDSNHFIRTTLDDGIEAMYLEKKLIPLIRGADGLFQLYGFRKVVLPQSLEGYDIYVVFGYYQGNGFKPFGNQKYEVFLPIYSKNFADSSLFEEIKLQGSTGVNKFFKASYPLETVFRLKSGTPIEYVPDDDYIQRALFEINNLN